jgi:hypothetical protein
MADEKTKACHVCREPAEKGCGACRGIKYCGKDHQRQDWPRHKLECTGTKKRTTNAQGPGSAAGGIKVAGPANWAVGLTKAAQAEWLVDCYRMRVDDDYAWGGCNLHGYVTSATMGISLRQGNLAC